ncbi:hypothetical protein [Hydrogenophaga soli]|nr:hypothetical protein [Burkholderiaceae bacterium]
MKKNLAFSLGCITLMTLGMAAPASSQVIINFTSTAPATSAVPLSPWLSAALAVSLAVLGLALIRRQAGRGVFVLLLSALVGSSALMQVSDGYAYGTPTLQTLTTSGTELTGTDVGWMTGPVVCGPIGYAWVKSGPGTATIDTINFRAGYEALNPSSPPGTPDVTLPTPSAPVCTVGTVLSGSASCVVWYDRRNPC